jgi:hypothetical protein
MPTVGSGWVARAYVAAKTRVNASEGLSAALLAAVIADQATRRLLSNRVQVWYQRVLQEGSTLVEPGAGLSRRRRLVGPHASGATAGVRSRVSGAGAG